MTHAELASLVAAPSGASVVLGIDHLSDLSARTLLFGYTAERHTWHVYLDAEGTIHRVVYQEVSHGTPMLIESSAGPYGGCSQNSEYIPNKRLYAESCDAEFCQLLAAHGVSLPFTTYNPLSHSQRLERHHGFAGRLVEALTDHPAEYVAFATAHHRLAHSPSLAARCVRHILLENRVTHTDAETGVWVQRHQRKALAAELVSLADYFDATEEPPSSQEDVLEALRELAGSHFAAYHADAVPAIYVQASTGVVKAVFNLAHELTGTSLKRFTNMGATIDELGPQAWRIQRPAEYLDLVVFQNAEQPTKGVVSYAVYQRHFGSEAQFEASYRFALRHALSQR